MTEVDALLEIAKAIESLAYVIFASAVMMVLFRFGR